jgi:Acetate kinase
MNIFVINSGSSSIKYQLIHMPDAKIICSGIVDKIGMADSFIIHKTYKEGKKKLRGRLLKLQTIRMA